MNRFTLKFHKYNGCGNDFILIDNRSKVFSNHHQHSIPMLCHRQKGIGADGLILLEESQLADYKMRIFNADGSEAEMCGNGIRCLMAFIHHLDPAVQACRIETMNASIPVRIECGLVKASMPDPFDIRWEQSFEVEGKWLQADYLNTGVPHAVLAVEDLASLDVAKMGCMIRFHPFFAPKGVNVNFVQLDGKGCLQIRTYERGVEEETLACGTGATAAAIAASRRWNMTSPIKVHTRSGQSLTIEFTWKGDDPVQVSMAGPAAAVFHGCVEFSILLS